MFVTSADFDRFASAIEIHNDLFSALNTMN